MGHSHARIVLKPSTDYYTQEESHTLFRPLKQKKKRRVRKAQADADVTITLAQSTMQVGRMQEANYVDDDDLQAALAKSRREALVKKRTPEELAQKILEASKEAMN